MADWGEEQHWSWQSFHATVQLIPSHFVPQSHRLLPPRQISNVSFLVCFPALFLFISICALLKQLLERAGVFRSVMETAENAILPPLLAGHVVDDNLGGAGGWCGNEGSKKEHKKPMSFNRELNCENKHIYPQFGHCNIWNTIINQTELFEQKCFSNRVPDSFIFHWSDNQRAPPPNLHRWLIKCCRLRLIRFS